MFVLLFSPISVAGFLGVLKDPAWFIAEQVQQPIPVAVSENSVVVAQQLGNMYLLGFFIAMSVFLTTSETKVIRAYLVALLLGDIGHIAFTCLALGKDRMLRPHEWNTMTCANVGFVVSCFGIVSVIIVAVPISNRYMRGTVIVGLCPLIVLRRFAWNRYFWW